MFKDFKKWFDRQGSITQFVLLILFIFCVRTFLFGLYQVPTGSMETNMLIGDRFFADKLTVWFMPLKRGEIIVFNDPLFEYSDNPFVRTWQNYVWGPTNWTKRLIALPGDHIKGVVENGKPEIYLNGQKLVEPYLNKYPLIAVWEHRDRGDQSGLCPVYKSYDPTRRLDDQEFYTIRARDLVKIPGFQEVREPGTPLPDNSDVFEYTLADDEVFALGDNRLGSFDSRHWGPLKTSLIHGKIVFRLWSLDSQESWWIVDLVKHPIDFWRRMRWSRFLNIM